MAQYYLDVRYPIETGWGTLTPFFNGTYISSYTIEDPVAGTIQGAGLRNRNNVGNPAPELRFNTGFTFTGEYNALSVFFRYIDGYLDDENGNSQIPSHSTVDARYTFSLGNFNEDLADTTLSIGVINAFDNTPPLINTSGGFDSRTHDPRGRVAYLELSTRF